MSLCTVCGRVYCDHTTEERAQTIEEIMRPLTDEEELVWRTGSDDDKIKIARKNAHLPVAA